MKKLVLKHFKIAIILIFKQETTIELFIDLTNNINEIIHKPPNYPIDIFGDKKMAYFV